MLGLFSIYVGPFSHNLVPNVPLFIQGSESEVSESDLGNRHHDPTRTHDDADDRIVCRI